MDKLNSMVIMNKNISDYLIKCTFIDEFNECGGYLLGNSKKENGILYFYITDIYFEKNIHGKNSEFIFPLLYEVRAKNYAEIKNLEILGCFHSHGQYPSQFSSVDKNVLEPYWASDKLCMIFSPKYFTLNVETVFKNKKVEKPQVLIKYGNRYKTFEHFYSEEEQINKFL